MRVPLIFIATFRALPGHAEALADALDRAVAATRAEPGNIHYDLYRGQDDPDLFMLHEGWRDDDALKAHMGTPHLKQLLASAREYAQAGPDGQPFVGTRYAMLTDRGAVHS